MHRRIYRTCRCADRQAKIRHRLLGGDGRGWSNEYCLAVPELQLLSASHGPALLVFELENRAYFAESISDRGEEFYDSFTEQLGSMLAEQAAGTSAFYVF